MAKKPNPAAKPASLTIGQANRRIEDLRRFGVESASAPENLDKPLDPDIRVTPEKTYHKIDVIIDDKPVSGMTIFDFQQQVGSSLVRMGGIGGVWTHNDYRFRGLSRRAIINALRWMRHHSYDTTMLFGIPSFYPKFGFAQSFPDTLHVLATRDAERPAAKGERWVDFTTEHLGAVLEMYHHTNARRTGPLRRDIKHWQPFSKGYGWVTRAAPKVLLGPRGRPIGYAAFHDAHLTAIVIEVGYLPNTRTQVFPAVLRAAAQRALDARLENIRLYLPEDHAMIDFCKPLGMKREITFRRDSSGMVRLINAATTLNKIVPVLASRAHGSGALTLHTNLDVVNLKWRAGKLAVKPGAGSDEAVNLPQWALAQLVYGYRGAPSLADAGLLRGSARAIAWVDQLFPVTPHFFYATDDF